MKKSDLNRGVIENFILFVTHCGNDELEDNLSTEMTFTPKSLYELMESYIEEDHVDGRENVEDHIVTFNAESSDNEKGVVIIADFGEERGTETIGVIQDVANLSEVERILKVISNPYK